MCSSVLHVFHIGRIFAFTFKTTRMEIITHIHTHTWNEKPGMFTLAFKQNNNNKKLLITIYRDFLVSHLFAQFLVVSLYFVKFDHKDVFMHACVSNCASVRMLILRFCVLQNLLFTYLCADIVIVASVCFVFFFSSLIFCFKSKKTARL